MYETSKTFNVELQNTFGFNPAVGRTDNDVHVSVYVVQTTAALSLYSDVASGSDIQ